MDASPEFHQKMPTGGGRRHNLASLINVQLMEEADPPASLQLGTSRSRPLVPGSNEELSKLAVRISSKLEMRDFKGAVHLACSGDSIAPVNADTIAQLRLKHPAPHHESTNPPPPSDDEVKESLTVDENTVIRAIQSFPKGSAGGADGLCPQHLRDMISPTAGEDREPYYYGR